MFKHIKKDLPASLVVFFVALPLCLGIALASGAPLFAGLIAGIVGGIVVGSISGAQLGVSGPAAGLAVIVLTAIQSLGFETFLLAVIIGGALQIILGLLKAGIIGYYFPSSVIKGMLAGIGITIIIQQIPNIFGFVDDGSRIFSPGEGFDVIIGNLFAMISPGVVILSAISLTILLLWDNVFAKKHKAFKLFPGSLAAVLIGILFYVLMGNSDFGILPQHLVTVPVPEDAASFFAQFTTPNFAAIGNPEVWITGITLAIVASLETLLSVEAIDKIDPLKRTTPTNRELFAQGTGNIVSGFIGGLPITQVIVRSSANTQSGGRTKLSTILHGFLLLISVITIPMLLNMIPLAVLAAVLLIVGYKLAKPALFKQMFKLGKSQFLPFIITILGVVFTDLLTGIVLGLIVGISVILINSYRNSHFLHKEGHDVPDGMVKMTLAEELTFLNKGAILRELNELPKNSYLILDVTKTKVLDYDVLEILDEFAIKAERKNINIKLISDRGEVENPQSYKIFFGLDVPMA